MRRFIAIYLAFFIPFFVYWLAGGNFERDFGLGITTVSAFLIAVIVATIE